MRDAMSDDLNRQLAAAVPEDEIDLWPKVRERLAQRQTAPAPVKVAPPKRRWPLSAAAAAAVLVAGIGLTQALWPKPVSAEVIIGRAQAALAAPAGERFQTLALQETVTYPDSTAEVSRWYEAPNRWRMEVSAGGKLQNLVVSDGTDMWNYYPQQQSVTVSEAAPSYAPLADSSPLGEKAESLADLLAQASRCFTPRVAGSATVAGRVAYVIDLRQTSCFTAAAPNQGGQQTLWVDKQTYMVLKAVFTDSAGTTVETREVTRITFDAPVPADTFRFAAPDGVTVWDERPKPAPAGYAELVVQMQELAKAADSPLFLPRTLPRGLMAGAPQRTPAGVEIAYSATGTGAIEAGTVQIMQRKAVQSDLENHMPDEQPVPVGDYPAWFLQGHRYPDGTGLWSNLTLVRDGTRISLTSLELSKEELMEMARSLERVP